MNIQIHLLWVASIVLVTALTITAPNAFSQSPNSLSVIDERQPQYRKLSLDEWPENGQVKLLGPLPSIIKVWLVQGSNRTPLEFGFNVDATEVTVFLPELKANDVSNDTSVMSLEFLIAENTTTHSDGVVVLSALDSKVIGTQAKLESHPGSHRIGFWLRQEDYVQWSASIPKGTYEVELVYSRAFETGTEVKLQFDEASLSTTLARTGSWYRYRVIRVGEVTLDDKPVHQVEVHVAKIINGGVMNLKAIVLTPAK